MVGGMEKLSFALAKEFSSSVDTTLITWGGSQKYLPFVYFLFLIKSLYLIPKNKIDHIHIGDALLSPLGFLLKNVFGIKTTLTVVGLDITFNFPGYQFFIPRIVAKLDKIICISDATKNECIKRNIPEEKCAVIPCGVYPEDWIVKATRKDLEKNVGKDLKDKKVIITVGRLVPRKGVYWFIKNVMPKLEMKVIHLIIGTGPEKDRIQELIKEMNLQERVILLGKISDEDLKIIYNTSDLFVMPNIKVKDTIEGFGLVAIEASSTGLPVIASDLEGISSAIINGKTGYLVESANPEQFIKAIRKSYSLNRKEIASVTRKNYSWEEIGKEYIKSI